MAHLAQPPLTGNIVISGETGVGKSSLINLIIGRESAVVANDVRGVTLGTECHRWVSDTQTYNLWDTPGLNEGRLGKVPPTEALNALRSLLTELARGGGVHLLIICMRGLPKVIEGMRQTYDTIVGIRDRVAPDVPLAAVVTDLEKRSSLPDIITSMDEWWMDNITTLSEFGMVFYDHACITTLPDNCHPQLPGRRALCQQLVRHLIIKGVSSNLACNIVIAGGVGAGKSSLVNLILDSNQALVGNDVDPATTTTSHYNWKTSSQTFRLWDTPELGGNFYGSQKHARELRSLFTDLSKRSGVQLLIICIRAFPRAMMAAKTTYNLVMKMRKKFSPATPVVAVITTLECLSTTSDIVGSMEKWWTSNIGVLADHDMSFSGHACITNLSILFLYF